MIALVGQLGIDLIRDHEQILFLDHLCDGFQIRPLHDRTRRVIRERQYQYLGLVRAGIAQFLRGQTEFVLCLQFDDHRFCPGQDRTGLIGYVAGLRDQHFVSRIDHRTQRDIDALGTADRHHDLMVVVILHTDAAL